MKKISNKKLSILAVAGLTCIIPGLVLGCGKDQSETDLFFTKGIKISCMDTLTTLEVDDLKLKDDSGNYCLFLKDSEGEAIDLHTTGKYSFINPIVVPKGDSQAYFMRAKVQYLGFNNNQSTVIEDVEDYFTVLPSFGEDWLLSEDGYYYNVKDGVLEWNTVNKSKQLEVNKTAPVQLFGTNENFYVVSETGNIAYDFIGAQIIIEAVNSDGANDLTLQTRGWTFETDKATGLKLSYNLNGGTTLKPADCVDLTEGSKVDITSIVPARRGYEFKEWNTAINGSGKGYVSGEKIKIGQTNITLYAQWTPRTYSITLNTDGGLFAEGENIPTKYTYGKAINLPTPTKEGYTFKGWFDKDGVKIEYITDNMVDDKALTARWELVKYTIFYTLNGGTILNGGVYEYSIEQGATLPTEVEKEGYIFDGWYDSYTPATETEDEVWGNKVSEVLTSDKGNKKFFAKWNIKGYAITLNANGGVINSGNVSGDTLYFGDELTSDLTKEGYVFAGWYLADDENTTYSKVGDFGDVETVDLFAKWAPKEITFKFNYNGGLVNGETGIASKDVNYNSQVGELPTPTKAGYKFDGWYTNDAFDGDPITNETLVTMTRDVDLYAKWTAEKTSYKVEYYFEQIDGSYQKLIVENSGDTDTTASVELKSFPGYVHNTNDKDVLSGTITGDGKLVLKIYYSARTYDIIYVTNGGSFVDSAVNTYKYGETVNLPSVEKTGFNFIGWYDNKNFEGSAITKITSEDTGNKTFYAKYEQCVFNVTLNKYDGTLKEGETDVTSYSVGEVTRLPILEKEGYTFQGWFADEAFSGIAIEEISADQTGDKVYYALWAPNTYRVTLNTNGGTIESENIDSYVHGTETSITNYVFKAGYVFAGWYDNPEFTGEQIEMIPSDAIGDKVYYAKWRDAVITFEKATSTGWNLDSVVLPSDYTNTSHAEKITIPSVDDIVVNKLNLGARYVRVNYSGNYSNVGEEINVYGDITITYVFEYFTELRIQELVDAEQILIEASTTRRWGNSGSLKFILPELDDASRTLVWSDGNRKLFGSSTYEADQYGITVTLIPSFEEGINISVSHYQHVNSDGNNYMQNLYIEGKDYVNLVKDKNIEGNYYAPELSYDGYRFLGWSKNNHELDALDNLILPGESFAVAHDPEGGIIDSLYGIWEEIKYTLTIDLNGGSVSYNGVDIETTKVFDNNNKEQDLWYADLATKTVGEETYYLQGVQIVSPVNYEALGYKIFMADGGARLVRLGSEGNRLPVEHDIKVKLIWSNEIQNQKIKFNLKSGEHVYYNGEEVTELTYNAKAYTQQPGDSPSTCLSYMNQITASKDGQTGYKAYFEFKNNLGNYLDYPAERMANIYNDEFSFTALAGGINVSIHWEKIYTAEVRQGDTTGFEVTGQAELEYTRFDNVGGSGPIDYLTSFYNTNEAICVDLIMYDSNTDTVIDYNNNNGTIPESNLGQVYYVAKWIKLDNPINPGSVVINAGTNEEEVIEAIQTRALIADNYNEYKGRQSFRIRPDEMKESFMIPGHPEYWATTLMSGERMISDWEYYDMKYLVNSDAENETYVYVKRDNDSDQYSFTYKVFTNGIITEEEIANIVVVENQYKILQKTDGTLLGYLDQHGNGNIYSRLVDKEWDFSNTTVDEASLITMNTEVNESDEFSVAFNNNKGSTYESFYELNESQRIVKYLDGIYLISKNGDVFYIERFFEQNNNGTIRKLYTSGINIFQDIASTNLYTNVIYPKEVDSSSYLTGSSLISEENLSVVWSEKTSLETKGSLIADETDVLRYKKLINEEFNKTFTLEETPGSALDEKYTGYSLYLYDNGVFNSAIGFEGFNPGEYLFIPPESVYIESILNYLFEFFYTMDSAQEKMYILIEIIIVRVKY